MRVLTTTALAALVLLGVWFARASADSPRPGLTVHASAYGRILFDGRRRALYAFTRDDPRHSNCRNACAGRWPPYIVKRTPSAGRGVAAPSIGTIRRGDGRLQATYAGKPLYRYVGDRKPLQVLCQNVREFGGLWLVIRRNGKVVR